MLPLKNTFQFLNKLSGLCLKKVIYPVNPTCVFNKTLIFALLYFYSLSSATAQYEILDATKDGFTWITTQRNDDDNFGAGYSMYVNGISNAWMEPQRNENDPEYYNTIEGGMGWWRDTRFGTHIAKYKIGAVAYNFTAWANGVGSGSTATLEDGQVDWTLPEGKYGAAQLSPYILFPPDGLNMQKNLNGEFLGYGHLPLPLTEPMNQTGQKDVYTGNQSWTLFFNAANFKGPVSFIVPTFWSKAAVDEPELEGLFLDSRPSNQNIGFGIEDPGTYASIAYDSQNTLYAQVTSSRFPVSSYNRTAVSHQIQVYSKDALWNDVYHWFKGGPVVQTGINQEGSAPIFYTTHNNGGDFDGSIKTAWYQDPSLAYRIDYKSYFETYTDENVMGFEWNFDHVVKSGNHFIMPEFYRLDVKGTENLWRPITEKEIPKSTGLLENEVKTDTPSDWIPYLTPLDPECHLQDPNSPWNNPGPSAGPFYADLNDGSTVTFYWYRFVDQPAIVHANLSEEQRATLQFRAELIHEHWKPDQEYLEPPKIGTLASVDPGLLVTPPAGMEKGYVPIVTRQEKSSPKTKVFILAGQSNMEGQGWSSRYWEPDDKGDLVDVLSQDEMGEWSVVGEPDNWAVVEDVWVYFERGEGTVSERATVGHGSSQYQIGPELMFAHEMASVYEEPVLIIKTAWGGKSLAHDFRPPSAEGETGAYYTRMIETVKRVTADLPGYFPEIPVTSFEYAGFGWFQGWNDGGSVDDSEAYEENLRFLVDDIRRDLGVSDLPIVIAGSGQRGYEVDDVVDGYGWNLQNLIRPAQEAVGCDRSFTGRVGYVDTRDYHIPYLSYEDPTIVLSPDDAVHHYNSNALTFLNIGREMGRQMIQAVQYEAYCERATQTITFELPSEVSIEKESLELAGTASSGLEVRYTSSDEAIVRVEGSVATLVSPGTVTLTAYQEGDDLFERAEPVEQTVVVLWDRAIKVFILAGQSNMQGHGSVFDAENDPGTLIDLVDRSNDWDFLGELNNWDTLENVWIYFERDEDIIHSQVTVGQGANSELFGPELMFAHEIDQMYEEPVLIIKTAWGGKSLAVDFRPPSAGGETGQSYQEMIEIIENVTSNIGSVFPALAGNDHEIAGFGWFQGWNDAENLDYANDYAENLDHLVQDVRTDLGLSNLPIVIANSGHGGTEPQDGWVLDIQEIIVPAQKSVACDRSYNGYTGYVDTQPYYLPYTKDIDPENNPSPHDAIHHFNHAALTFLNIGQQMGIKMAAAIAGEAYCERKEQTITFDLPETISLTDGPLNLDGKASSGLDINYSSSDENILSIAGSTAQLISAGQVTITAGQEGDDFYEEAEPVSVEVIIVSDEILSNDSNEIKLKVYGTKNKLHIEFPSSSAEQIMIFTLSGKTIFNEPVEFNNNKASINAFLNEKQVFILKVQDQRVKLVIK